MAQGREGTEVAQSRGQGQGQGSEAQCGLQASLWAGPRACPTCHLDSWRLSWALSCPSWDGTVGGLANGAEGRGGPAQGPPGAGAQSRPPLPSLPCPFTRKSHLGTAPLVAFPWPTPTRTGLSIAHGPRRTGLPQRPGTRRRRWSPPTPQRAPGPGGGPRCHVCPHLDAGP